MTKPKTTKPRKPKASPTAAASTRAAAAPSRDATRIFHREWLGLAQPIEGLVFSVPALDEAPAPAARAEITAAIQALEGASAETFFRTFLGYDRPGMLVPRAELPEALAFYAPESRQEIRPTFAIARAVAASKSDDPFAIFDAPASAPEPSSTPELDAPSDAPASFSSQYIALVWDLELPTLDLDAPEDTTGPWRYPPTAKLERLLRHVGIPVGFLTNRRHLRVVYAPPGEATSHLTFRFDDLADAAGRPLALALDLLFHARRTYGADAKHTFEGLLAESRRRQADVTEELASQVKDAVELLLSGFERAASLSSDGHDWLSAAMEEGHVYGGILNAVLRLVFLLYAEDRSLLPVAHPTYAAHLSVLGLYERLVHDAGAHPESMHQRFGAYGALVALFRAVYFGVRHGDLHLPPRQGRLFDPSAFPFLEGGLPEWTAAVSLPEERAAVRLPTIDDGTLYEVLHRLIVLDGQRISYRDLSVEQIGAVYESLMGFEVKRAQGPSVRLGKLGFWVDVAELRRANKTEQTDILDERCGMTKAALKNAQDALKEHEKGSDDDVADALVELAAGGKSERERHRVKAGQLMLQPTASRRSTGSHYTPRSLSEKVVRRTLEPILACLGEAPTAAQILELKVCDPAMGSGAFLVEACRFLGDAVVEAWRRSGELPAVIEKEGDALLHAKRMVAQRCLYGVDKNAAAVELAKLSLWLETLSADKPFTFLDHVLRHGDSLVGLDLEQVRAFHWKPDAQLPTVARLVDRALAEVKEGRDAIQALADDESDWAQREKRRLLEISELAMDRVKLVADVCVGAFFAEAKSKAREAEREKRLGVVEAFLAADEGDEGAAGLRERLEEWARVIRKQHAPFHWHLELPEVFFLERPDPLERGAVNRAAFMDAFVGNPPFIAKNGIIATNGDAYIPWLLATVEDAHGAADLCAYFLRRAAALIGAHGTFGFIVTKSLAEGDSREAGLKQLLRRGFEIYDARSSFPWPGDASVAVSTIHMRKGVVRGPIRLDDEATAAINSRLEPSIERPDAHHFPLNAELWYLGPKIYGDGFVLSPEERAELVSAHPETAERTFALIGGEEINSSPTLEPHRFVINFGQLPLAECSRRWAPLLDIVEKRVKPERDLAKDTTADGAHRKKYWWQFAQPRPKLFERLPALRRCLVNSQVTKHLVFAWQPTDRVWTHTLYVYPLEASTAFAVMQSRVHEPWARLLSSSLEDRLRYAASDCFETFPFPNPDPRTAIPELEDVGQRLYDARATYMLDTRQGLTQTYNLLKEHACHDAPVVELRRLHEAMDRAVLDAYGWTDLVVPVFCPASTAERKAIEVFQDEVTDRLFVLNAQRASEEAHGDGGIKATAEPRGVTPSEAKRTRTTGAQGDLFGGDR